MQNVGTSLATASNGWLLNSVSSSVENRGKGMTKEERLNSHKTSTTLPTVSDKVKYGT